MSAPRNKARKGQAPFKPPSRVGDAHSSSSATRTSVQGRGQARQSSSGLLGFSSARSSLNATAPGTSLLDLEPDVDEVDEAEAHTHRTTTEMSVDAATSGPVHLEGGTPPIPLKLLARLIYEGFEDKNMKIGKEALTVTAKYIEAFVREAMARATQERKDALGDAVGGDTFLQVSYAPP